MHSEQTGKRYAGLSLPLNFILKSIQDVKLLYSNKYTPIKLGELVFGFVFCSLNVAAYASLIFMKNQTNHTILCDVHKASKILTQSVIF